MEETLRPPGGETVPAPFPAVAAGDLVVSSVLMPAPVTSERAALYLTVYNQGTEPDTLLSVDVGALGNSGLHETFLIEGVARMRSRGSVPVAAGGMARFRPGGLHVMIEELIRAPAAGDTVPVELGFARAGVVRVRALVVSYGDLEAALGPGG